MYGMNSGYVGWAMSVRAAKAYESGEKPKSKWTKKAMLTAICDACAEHGLVYEPTRVEGMRKEELFHWFFALSSRHHTSKFCNLTDFYAVNPDDLRRAFRPEDVAEGADGDPRKKWEEALTRDRVLIEEAHEYFTAKAKALDKEEKTKREPTDATC